MSANTTDGHVIFHGVQCITYTYTTSGVLEHKMASEPSTTLLLNLILTTNSQAIKIKSSF